MNVFAILLPALILAIPVHLAAKWLGGQSTYFKAILLTILGYFVSAACYVYLSAWAGVVSFVLLLALYKIGFSIGWLRAFFVWILSIVLMALFILIFGVLLGLAIYSLG